MPTYTVNLTYLVNVPKGEEWRTVEKTITLPFPPYVGLKLTFVNPKDKLDPVDFEIGEVHYWVNDGHFEAYTEGLHIEDVDLYCSAGFKVRMLGYTDGPRSGHLRLLPQPKKAPKVKKGRVRLPGNADKDEPTKT